LEGLVVDRLKIDHVATETGLTKRTIRYYEQIGILPHPPRSEGGVRYYSQEHVDLLKRITNAKDALGFSLQELQYYLSLNDMIESYKADYKQLSSTIARKEKLIDIINTINDELKLIVLKIEKIENVRDELVDLKKRAQVVVDTLS
jgi:DNA-binding transcriptional MerR regulator